MTKPDPNDISANAANNAAIAAKTAADSAVIIATVANDVDWMKKSLINIESKLDEMSKSFVTYGEHQDVLKKIDDHENRLNKLETANTKTTVLLSIGISLIMICVS
jgi:hypothetical protein